MPARQPTTRAAAAAKRISKTSAERTASAQNNLTILVVDDVSDTRRLYAGYFAHVGARVLVASNGAEALELIEDVPPDAVLLDLSMPQMTGWEVLAKLRSGRSTQALPIVVITGYVAPGVQEAALNAGADLYLTKPCLPHVAFDFILKLVRPKSC